MIGLAGYRAQDSFLIYGGIARELLLIGRQFSERHPFCYECSIVILRVKNVKLSELLGQVHTDPFVYGNLPSDTSKMWRYRGSRSRAEM
jgi:hypothetical protein